MLPVIQVSGVRKTYGSTVAVDEVSFEVNDGEIFGLIGPNGAGKTTTMECIEGLRTRDRGTISVLGLDPLPRRLQIAEPHRRTAPAGAAAEADQSVGGDRPVGFAIPEKNDRRRTIARTARPCRQAERLVHDPFGWPEAATVHCPCADQRSGGSVSRRADHRAGPTGAAGDLGPGARHPRAWQDGPFDHSSHGRSGAVV